MKTEKAIRILEHKVKQDVFQVDPDALIALQLSIEALRQIGQIRVYAKELFLPLLPGETGDTK